MSRTRLDLVLPATPVVPGVSSRLSLADGHPSHWHVLAFFTSRKGNDFLFATTLKASHTLSSVLLGLHASGLPWPLHDVGFLSNLRLPISNFLRKYTHGV